MKHFKILFFTVTLLGISQNYCLQGNEIEISAINATTPGAVYFTPPPGWRMAEQSALPDTIKMMVVGETKGSIPPSINLSVETYKGTLKDYLQLVKRINERKGLQWNDLGKIKTPAGEGSLSQVDTKINGEDVRQMHAILKKNGIIYILTAAAQKEEFSALYKSFFESMSSLHINEEPKTS